MPSARNEKGEKTLLKPTLSELIRPYRSISIIGMCKNAGKTTVLNQIIKEVKGSGRILALTSIGRDGEDKDLVTGTKKPGIHVEEGTLVATASDLILLLKSFLRVVNSP